MESIVTILVSFLFSLFGIGQTMPMSVYTYTHTMEATSDILSEASEETKTLTDMTEAELLQVELILKNEISEYEQENTVITHDDIRESILAGFLLGLFFSAVYIRKHYTVRTFFQAVFKVVYAILRKAMRLWSAIQRNK